MRPGEGTSESENRAVRPRRLRVVVPQDPPADEVAPPVAVVSTSGVDDDIVAEGLSSPTASGTPPSEQGVGGGQRRRADNDLVLGPVHGASLPDRVILVGQPASIGTGALPRNWRSLSGIWREWNARIWTDGARR